MSCPYSLRHVSNQDSGGLTPHAVTPARLVATERRVLQRSPSKGVVCCTPSAPSRPSATEEFYHQQAFHPKKGLTTGYLLVCNAHVPPGGIWRARVDSTIWSGSSLPLVPCPPWDLGYIERQLASMGRQAGGEGGAVCAHLPWVATSCCSCHAGGGPCCPSAEALLVSNPPPADYQSV